MSRTPFEDRQARLLFCKRRLEVALELDSTGRRIRELTDVQARLALLLHEEEQELLAQARQGRLA